MSNKNKHTKDIAETPITPVEKLEEKEYTTLNLGPSHPATHGVFQNVLTMDGEIIVDSVPTVGYIHRMTNVRFPKCNLLLIVCT